MPGYSPIQKSFASGEISPRFGGQTDSPLYQRALSYCKDFVPMPQGSLLMRGGTQYVTPIATAEGCRLIPFKMQDGRDFVIEFGNLTARVYDRNGTVVGVGANKIVNGDFAAGDANWGIDYAAPNSLFVDGVLYVGRFEYSGVERTGNVYQDVVLDSAGTYELSWTATEFQALNGYGPGTLTVTAKQGGVVLASKTVSVAGDYSVSFDITDTATPVRVSIISNRTNNTRGPVTGYWQQLFAVVVDNVVCGKVGAALDIAPTPWTLAQLPALQFVAAPGQSKMYFAHPDVAPQALAFTSRLVWTLGPITYDVDGAPAEWGAANYPSVVEIFQGRLWFAATKNQPTQVWFSGSGDFTNFMPSGTNASDPSSFKLQTKGSVKWMQGSSEFLMLGTESGEYGATSDSGLLAPGAIKTRPLSTFGSASIQAVFLGGQVVYVASDQRKIRSIDYSFEKSNWQTFDLTFYADHITRGGRVADIHFARDPNGTLVLRMEDGSLILANYSPAEKVLSWFRVVIGGSVSSAAVVEQPEGSQLWMVVKRATTGGASVLNIEALNLADANTIFLDSWKLAPCVNGVLTGLNHLEGMTVAVLVDGVRSVIDYVVVGGEVALTEEDAAGTEFYAGLRFTARSVTLPLEGGNPQGTSQGLSVHYSEIAVRLSNSARPLINGERAAGNKPFGNDLDTLEELLTKDVRVAGSEVSEGGQITIEQDEPYRTEICGLFGQAEVSRV